MNRRIITAVFAGLAIGVSALGIAAEPDRSMGGSTDQQRMHGTRGTRGTQGSQEMRGMQGMRGMEGMMGMMGACQGMMGGHTTGAGLVPQLPPGNEKLQLQMWAEIMQKAGEITAKYASQIK